MIDTQESFSPDQVKNILENDYGILVFPKISRDIPSITAETLRGKVKAQREDIILQCVGVFDRFLHMPAIGDTFGADHVQRTECYKKIASRFGEATRSFLNQYADNNQLRLNKLSNVFMGFENISAELLDPQLQNYFQTTASELHGILMGTKERVPYEKISSVQQKLDIVHTFEDKIVEALERLSA